MTWATSIISLLLLLQRLDATAAPPPVGSLRWLSWYSYTYKSYSLPGQQLLDDAHSSLWMETNLSSVVARAAPRPTLFFLARDPELSALWGEAAMKANIARRRASGKPGAQLQPDRTVLPADWRARLASAARTIRQWRAGPGGMEGVQLGDELVTTTTASLANVWAHWADFPHTRDGAASQMCRGVPPSNLSAVAAELRRLLPSTVWLFTNECKGVHLCRTPGAKSWVSPFLDVVG